MSFSRLLMPATHPTETELTEMLAGIGMNVAARAKDDANIEDTLYYASLDGLVRDDLRALSLVTQWLDVHIRRVNAVRIVRLIALTDVDRMRAYWSAIAHWHIKDRRFSRLLSLYKGPTLDLLSSGTEFHIRRRGEDPRFKGSMLRVPNEVLRVRDSDVLSPMELARRHRAYRWRIIAGPTYRADMLALLETDPTLSVAELARKTYGSFATAHEVKRDWETLRNSPNRFSIDAQSLI